MRLYEPFGVVLADGRPFVFVRDAYARLWVRTRSGTTRWNGTTWSWTNLGKPAGVDLVMSIGAEAIDGGRPYCFVRGSDGNLWVCWWNGSAWNWANQIRA